VPVTEDQFFRHLEMRVSGELAGMRQKELRSLWCDGFTPDDFQIHGERCRFIGRVWLVFGQREEQWQFVLYLGPARPREKIDWAALLPAKDVTGWLALDFETKFMKVNPQAAHAGGEPAEKS
jgi:hypothetical protein